VAIEPDPCVQEPDWVGLNLVGKSLAFREALVLLDQFAKVDATVLLCGETGTGKELAARAIHYLSSRRHEPFVPINCGALPDSLFEAELFGHARGAFTDARASRTGIVGLAQGGTLFLDEIDSLSPHGQSAILRFVQDRSYRPIGCSRTEQSDLRLIAATNIELDNLASAGKFRKDLLFRLNVLSVNLPPLRDRADDALLLAEAFLQRLIKQYHSEPRCLDAASRACLKKALPWPGNVRELEHRVHRAFLLCKGDTLDLGLAGLCSAAAIDPTHVGYSATDSFAAAKARVIHSFERNYLAEVLALAGGNLTHAARIAGKERSRFGKLVRKHGLQRNGAELS